MKVKWLLVVLCLAMVVTACGKPQTKDQPKTYEVIRSIKIGMPADIVTLDPQESRDRLTLMVCNMVYSRLFKRNINNQLVPDILERWELVDENTYDFYIHEGASFHNGDPVLAKDVIFTLNRVAETGQWQTLLDGIDMEALEEMGEKSFRLKTKAPTASLIAHLEHPAMGIVSHKTAEGLSLQANGAGPYQVDRWKMGEYVSLIPFEDYVGDSPANDGLLFWNLGNEDQRVEAIEEGALDLALDVDKEREINQGRIETYPTLDFVVLGVNGRASWLQDPALRQALRYMTNPEEVSKKVGRLGRVHGGILPESARFATAIMPVSNQFDDGKAVWDSHEKSKNGISLIVPQGSFMVEMGQELKNQWQKAGISVLVQEEAKADYYESLSSGDHPLFLAHYHMITDDPDDLLFRKFYSLNEGLGGNWTFTKNPEIDQVLLRGRQVLAPEEREGIYRQLQETLSFKMPWLFIWEDLGSVGVGQDVQGFSPQASGYHLFQYMSVQGMEKEIQDGIKDLIEESAAGQNWKNQEETISEGLEEIIGVDTQEEENSKGIIDDEGVR